MLTDKDKEILAYVTNGTGKLVAQRCLPSVIDKRGWTDYLRLRYTDNSSEFWLKETLYRLLNDLEIAPVCKTCGNKVKFASNNTYPTFCCAKCRNTDPDVLQKNKDAVSSALLKKYQEHGDEIKAKRANTIKEHYGVDSCSPFAVKEIQDKAMATIKENRESKKE